MTAAVIILGIVLLAAVAVFAVDAGAAFSVWFKRIHIGRYDNAGVWQRSVSAVCSKWLKKLPLLPINDNRSYLLLHFLKGEFSVYRFLPWQKACLLLGLGANMTDGSVGEIESFTKKDEIKALKLSEYTIGNVMLLFSLGETPFADEPQIKEAADIYAERILSEAGDGTMPYLTRTQLRYVDTIGMLCPFLMQYAKNNGCRPAAELAFRQIDEYFEFGVDCKTGLPFHCFFEKTKLPMGIIGWGRGCGWLAVGLMDCYLQIEGVEGFESETAKLKEKMLDYARTLLKYQRENGAYETMLFGSGKSDSSATAFIGWFMARVYRLTGEECFKQSALLCRSFLMKVTRRTGEVDFAQGDTLSVAYYSSRFDRMPAAQGFALRLAAETEDMV